MPLTRLELLDKERDENYLRVGLARYDYKKEKKRLIDMIAVSEKLAKDIAESKERLEDLDRVWHEANEAMFFVLEAIRICMNKDK